MNDSLNYSTKEFCAAIGISMSTFYAMLREGRGPQTIRIGGRRFVRRETAEQWLREHEVA